MLCQQAVKGSTGCSVVWMIIGHGRLWLAACGATTDNISRTMYDVMA